MINESAFNFEIDSIVLDIDRMGKHPTQEKIDSVVFRINELLKKIEPHIKENHNLQKMLDRLDVACCRSSFLELSGKIHKIKEKALSNIPIVLQKKTVSGSLKSESAPVRLGKAVQVAKRLQENSESTCPITPYIREPIENGQKVSGLTKPGEKFFKTVSYERFVSALRKNFASTLEDIGPNVPYVILGDQEEKSTNWVISHVLDIAYEHPPQAVISRSDIREYLQRHPDVSHVILMDDAAYSGNQASAYIKALSLSIRDTCELDIHVCIPYMTKHAHDLMAKNAGESVHVRFSDQRIWMPSYEDLGKLGYYDDKFIERPNVEHLISMTMPELPKNCSKDERMLYQKLVLEIISLQKNVFKLTDSAFIDKLKNIRNEILKILEKEFASTVFRSVLEELKDSMEIILHPVLRHPPVPLPTDTRHHHDSHLTPTAFSHKIPDSWSTSSIDVERALRRSEVPPPYKSDEEVVEQRQGLIQELHNYEAMLRRYSREEKKLDEQIRKLKEALQKLEKVESCDAATDATSTDSDISSYEDSEISSFATIDEGYGEMGRLGKEQIVISNRGCFILADNYCDKPENNDDQLILVVEGQEFPFGGIDGLFQWKLEEGKEVLLKRAGGSVEGDIVLKYNRNKGLSYNDILIE